MASLIKRNDVYHLQYYAGHRIRRRSLKTKSRQIAKEQLRQFESAQLRGIENPLPTRTPVPEVLSAYIDHIRAVKTARSVQKDIAYLRQAFGPVCPALEITNRKTSRKASKGHQAAPPIGPAYFETVDLSLFFVPV